MVHSKRRNRLHQERMNDLVYVMYNLKLTGRDEKKGNERDVTGLKTLGLDDVGSDDEWINEEEMKFFDGSSSIQPTGDEEFIQRAIRDQLFGGLNLGEESVDVE